MIPRILLSIIVPIAALFFSIQTAKAQTYLWANNLDKVTTKGIATDTLGNTYVTGFFWGTADFDPGPGVYNLSAGQVTKGFITKCDPAGNFIWAKCFAGSDSASNSSNSIATDNQGNVYVTGNYSGSIDFDPGAGTFILGNNYPRRGGIFVVKLNTTGDLAWAKSIGNNSSLNIEYDEGYSISVSKTNGVYFAGYFADTLDFDPGPGVHNIASVGQWDLFVAKLDSAGNYSWARNILCFNNGSRKVSVVPDAHDNAILTGYCIGGADFDPGSNTTIIPSLGVDDIFVAKYNASGVVSWAKSIGGTSYDQGKGVAVDKSDNIYLTGFFTDSADFDPGPGTAMLTASGKAAFICKLTPGGDYTWAKSINGKSTAENIAVSAEGNCFLTGNFSGSTDFDPGIGVTPLYANGLLDMFVASLDEVGNFRWATSAGNNDNDRGIGIALSNDIVYTTGQFSGTVDFDPGPGTALLTGPANLVNSFILSLTQNNNTQTNSISACSIQQWQAYPNPVYGGQLIMDMEGLDNGQYTMKMTNMLGQLCLEKQLVVKSSATTVDVSALTPGMYQLEVKDAQGNNRGAQLVIKQ